MPETVTKARIKEKEKEKEKGKERVRKVEAEHGVRLSMGNMGSTTSRPPIKEDINIKERERSQGSIRAETRTGVKARTGVKTRTGTRAPAGKGRPHTGEKDAAPEKE